MYNPWCLERMKSNMSIQLITHTPDKVRCYMTKGGNDKEGMNRDKSENIILKTLMDCDTADAHRLAKRVENMTEVCHPEAFFRLDPSMHMADTNVKVEWMDVSFPDKRGTTFRRAGENEQGVSVPERSGEFLPNSRIEDKYQKK